jgi:glycolate oxidase
MPCLLPARPLAVALPKTTAQVAADLKYCHRYGVPAVPHGAGTSLSGGAIPQEHAVVLCLSKMARILEVDYANWTATVQAGTTNLSISKAVGTDGFFYAPDPSSQLACIIGGNIGMNSGGAHCLKYGVTTNNLLGPRPPRDRRHRRDDSRTILMRLQGSSNSILTSTKLKQELTLARSRLT